MAHVVTENCQNCRYTDCVLVCPVDCFYPLNNMLVIDPDECIDCSACVAECPVEAIYSEDELPSAQQHMLEYNAYEAYRVKNDGAEPQTDQQEPLPTAESKRQSLGW